MIFLNLFFSFLIALEVVVLLDTIAVCKNKILSLKLCLLLYILTFGAVFAANWFFEIYRALAFAQLGLFAVLLLAALCFFWYQIRSAYTDPGKKAACPFQNQTVMVIVPHQDDELNLMGAELYRQLIKGKNRVFTLFVTNGDYLNNGLKRLKEAINVNRKLGLKKENVIFLGYGGGWRKDCPNIYNGAGRGLLTSHCGKTKTYGIKKHPAFRDGADYTTENFFGDFKNAVLSIKPDVIFCSDYDCQPMTSLVSEHRL